MGWELMQSAEGAMTEVVGGTQRNARRGVTAETGGRGRRQEREHTTLSAGLYPGQVLPPAVHHGLPYLFYIGYDLMCGEEIRLNDQKSDNHMNHFQVV